MQFLRQFFAQGFLEFLDANPGFALKLDLQYRFLRAGRPEVNRVDRVIRRLSADEAQADLYIFRSDLALDYFQRLQRDLLRAVDTRARLSAQAQLKLARVDHGENLCAERATHDGHKQAANRKIRKDDHATPLNHRGCEARVTATKSFEDGLAGCGSPAGLDSRSWRLLRTGRRRCLGLPLLAARPIVLRPHPKEPYRKNRHQGTRQKVGP